MKIEGFLQMLEQIQKERGIPKEALVSAIEAALLSACKKRYKVQENLTAKIEDSGEAKVWAKKVAVSKVKDDDIEISTREAKKINPKAKAGDEFVVDVTPHDFGRLAAQTAKQVIIQRIREAEKDTAFDEFNSKTGDIINGVIQRKERNGYLVNLGRIETLLPMSEVIPGEYFRPKDHVKLFVVETKKTGKGPMVIVSRTHPGLVKKLFELEVPEILQGVLEIKGISREAGRRTKIAVLSKDKNVSAVGTCIGHMGNRIQNVVKELGNERVDVIEWNEDPRAYITNALSPAKASKVILNEAEHMAKVLVPEKQLSLAIGKEGQNVRLAAKLAGWKIDIMSEEEAKKEEDEEGKAGAEAKGEKFKVHEIAKEIGITSKLIVAKLAELGVEVKGATSNITKEIKEQLLAALKGGAVEVAEKAKEEKAPDAGEEKAEEEEKKEEEK